MKINAETALKNAFCSKKMNRYPNDEDEKRSREGLIFPSLSPTFYLKVGSKIFTVGSCFARNIEAFLDSDFELPTRKFVSPIEEWNGASNGLLNEYNPAAISQRLLWAANQVDTSLLTKTISEDGEKYNDLLLAVGSPVTKFRLVERRKEIDKIYMSLSSSQVMILTLGLNECWYDLEAQVYLNRPPHPKVIRSDPSRYRFEILDADESYFMLEKAIMATLDSGVRNIILTVSPVPLQTTFSGKDCVVANSYSKAVMRVVAQQLTDRFEEIDYFPSYEIVMSGGLSSFGRDHVHVYESVVRNAVEYLKSSYVTEE